MRGRVWNLKHQEIKRFKDNPVIIPTSVSIKKRGNTGMREKKGKETDRFNKTEEKGKDRAIHINSRTDLLNLERK